MESEMVKTRFFTVVGFVGRVAVGPWYEHPVALFGGRRKVRAEGSRRIVDPEYVYFWGSGPRVIDESVYRSRET